MAKITAEFPLVRLGEAWRDLQEAMSIGGVRRHGLDADEAVGG
jgi:hypothetical protein